MGRLVGGVVLSVVVLAAGAGCSGDDDTAASERDRDRSTTTSVDSAATTSSAAGEGSGATTTTTSPSPPPASGDPGAPPQLPPSVAEAGGWRMVVDFPTAGGAVNPSAALCLEISGPSREPVVVLEVTLRQTGTDSGRTLRVEGAVGRNALHADFSDQSLGPYDLHVQLVADGAPVDGVAVTVPDVSLVESFVEITCS